MIRNMKNREIYAIGILLNTFVNSEGNEKRYLPAKINFLIQKNKKAIDDICIQLEKVRLDVIKKYADIDEENGTYQIPLEIKESVNNELDELLNLTQKIDISKIKISDLNGLEFTLEQMEALMFMIEE